MAQDRRLELAELVAGHEPELLGEAAAVAVEGFERVGLPAGVVAREHGQADELLP